MQGQVGKLKKKPTKTNEPKYEKLGARNTKQNISKLFTEENFIPLSEPQEEPVFLLMT